jgi:hypothetical protein
MVTAPAIYWLLAGGHDLVSVYARAVAPTASDRLRATLTGLGLALFAPLAFLFPLDVILVVLFPRMVREAASSVKAAVSRPMGEGSASVSWEMLILHITLAGFLILILGALLTGATHYLERYMHPLFLLTPVWLLAMVERTGNPSRKARVLILVLVAVTAAVLPVRTYDLLQAMGSHCKKCRVAIPYDGLAAALTERGFRSGTIIAESRHDAGNLRRFFPQARISCLESPSYAPPLRGEWGDQVALVLSQKSRARDLLEARKQVAALGAHFEAGPQEVTIPWQPWPDSAAPRTWQWSVLVLNLAAPE